MKKHNISNFLLTFYLCIFFFILLSKTSSGAHYQYESCVPKNCGHGPNVSFPFYVPGLQESYCAVLRSEGKECPSRIRNTTFLPSQFDYVNSTPLHLFSSCREPLPDELSRRYKDFIGIDEIIEPHKYQCVYFMFMERLQQLKVCLNAQTVYAVSEITITPSVINLVHEELDETCMILQYNVSCGSHEDGKNWTLALYDKDENSTNIATEKCEENIVTPVEEYVNKGMVCDLEGLLRKGFMMNWTAIDCSGCENSGGHCGFNATSHLFRCFCLDRPHAVSCKPAIAGSAVFLGLCFVFSYVIYHRRKRISGSYLLSRNISSDPSSKSDIEGGSLFFGIPIFSYTELEEATNNFDSSRELGDGGFGTVYYGKLRDGREVAIKRLYEHNYRRVEQFINEIKILTCLRHPNLVSLYGCTSRRSRELLLVYEYIPNGTVADHLHGERAKEAPLAWPVRMSIAIETANALAYLHKKDIIHRDVKTNNILLDNNFCVKVADFGLSRLFPNDVTHISTAPQGTPGYVDPEYHQCYQLTDKSDVYSFGVVLIELISSMPAVDITRHRHEINLANLAMNRIQRCAFDELIDSSLGYDSDGEVTRMTTSVAELAFRCLQLEKDLRPSMEEVLDTLKDIQAGEDCKFEKIKGVNGNFTTPGKIPPCPETDDAMLLKKKRFRSSPVAVTDVWASSGSTTASFIG
ncbi:Serine/threonine protein kinase [Handroanthus impetiginosus]|uniref:non-specific serine/threonine protein kinase n=1 Tax=Handroanthus impetiginosus TaxID=429701 RepID=A0A2G9H785_9LAMI|nr:Serine/threonine protein kinase [Handroanthus impetiginosus]